MIRTWIADISPLYDSRCYRKYYEKLPDWRKEKADYLRCEEKRLQSVAAWTLYEKSKKISGVQSTSVFNLSHSGQYVICSLDLSKDCHKLGCDIEKTGKNKTSLAEHFFCRSEYETIIGQCSEQLRTECFYRYWVLKESFMKATRLGSNLGLNEFEIVINEQGQPKLGKRPEKFKENYYFKEYKREGCYIAVCTTSCQIDGELYEQIL